MLIFSVLCVLVSSYITPSRSRSGANHLEQELKRIEQLGAKLEEDMVILSEQINNLQCKNESGNVSTVKRSLQSKAASMQDQYSYGQQQPMQQQSQQQQPQQQQSQQQNSQQQQPQQQQSQQQQPQQQQQYYSSNMMMKRQMGGKINHNSQQPMSAYSQYSNSYGAQSGYGQPIGQSQMMKRQQQSKLAQAFHPSQQGQQQQQLPQQYGYPPIQHYMQMGGINMQPEQFPYFQQPQYYDNIGFDENQQDSYEPVDGPYVYDDNVEEPVMGDVVKRELM
ncbi:unnamed protein product [Schistosoma mattheei]|uniref:Uncharacterized protein n=2 Tax=Schistosoma mattheei TaxID=31246 RepID=A0A183NNG5_9TREM|nr:unnamed protein product [Schistosoma mattheei]